MESILLTIIHLIAELLNVLIFIRVIASWVNQNQFNPALLQLHKITDPLLAPFRNIIPTEKIGIDLSPIFALMALQIIERFLSQLIMQVL